MDNKVGKMVEYLRKKKSVQISDLCRGICAETVIIRLESGEQMPGYLLLERIFSRLGKSVNKIEILFRDEDFYEYCLRCAIDEAMEKKKYEEAAQLLQEYKQINTVYQVLYDQYILKTEAVLLMEQKNSDPEDIVKLLTECISMTLPDIKIYALDQECISEEEMTLLLMWLEQRIRAGEPNVNYDCYRVLDYLSRHDWDEEILVNIYPKAVWICLESIHSLHQLQEEGKYIEKVIQLLLDNGILIFLPQYLERKIICLKEMGNPAAAEIIEKQVDALKWVYESYHQPYPDEQIRIWRNNYQQKKLYLMKELIRQERKNLHISQEQLADMADLDQKTLSRIETGAHAPKPTTYRKLQRALQMERDRYSTVLEVEDFELLELERDLSRELFFNHHQKAAHILDKLKKAVDMTSQKNCQYITYVEIKLKVLQGEMEVPDAIPQLIRVFQMTREYDIRRFLTVILSMTEVSIVNYIAILYMKIRQIDKSILICESVLRGFDHSRVDGKYHYKEISLILDGLQCYCEEEDQLQKAVEYSDRLLMLELKCDRVDALGKYLMQKNYILERMNEDDEICKEGYKKVYQLLSLVNNQEYMLILGKHYLEKYDEVLEI